MADWSNFVQKGRKDLKNRFIRKMIACLLAGTLVAAVPGELLQTEKVFGAEEPIYDEIPAEETTEIPEDDTDGYADIISEEADVPYAETESEAPAADREPDIFSVPEPGGLNESDDEESPIELKELFYEDYEHASGGVVPVIWNTSDNTEQKRELESFTEEIVGAESLQESYINPVRSGVRNQDGNSCWVHSLTTSSEMSMISAHLADELDYSERQILYGYFNQTGGDNGVPVSGSWGGRTGKIR